jgi:hypothetical protein
MLKNSNKENKYGGECVVLEMTVAGTVDSPILIQICRC